MSTFAVDEDDFFCYAKDKKWKVCKRCPDLSKKCTLEDPKECLCENIQVYDPKSKTYKGGSDCKDGYCFISKFYTIYFLNLLFYN